jgi:hypothetical protein
MVRFTCHPSYVGSVSGKIVVQASLGINMRSYLKKIAKIKKGWGVAQVGACLASTRP